MKRRNTPAKQEVWSLLSSTRSALSQEDIEQRTEGKMDRVTIYRVLNSFCEDGLVHRILSDDGKYYFALCRNCNEAHHTHDHFHFRCLKCGKVECLKEEVTIKMPKGYRLENTNCFLSGYCRACA